MSKMTYLANRQVTPLAVGVAAVSVFAVTATWWWRHHSSSKKGAVAGGEDAVTKDPPPISPAILHTFEDCAARIRELGQNRLTNSDKLWLYALFKQATVGDAPDSVNGSSWNLVASQAKHQAWRKLYGMPRAAAYYQYIAIAQIHLDECGDDETMEHADNRTKTTETTNGSESSDIDDLLEDDEANDPYNQRKAGSNGGGSSSMGISVSRPVDIMEPGYANVMDEDATMEQRYLHAAANDSLETIRALVGTEPSLNLSHKDDVGQTALHMAADNGALNVLRYLLTEHQMDVNAADDDGISVLQAAVIAGQIEVCRLLLQHGANPDQEDHDGDTPRRCAADDGSKELQGLF